MRIPSVTTEQVYFPTSVLVRHFDLLQVDVSSDIGLACTAFGRSPSRPPHGSRVCVYCGLHPRGMPVCFYRLSPIERLDQHGRVRRDLKGIFFITSTFSLHFNKFVGIGYKESDSMSHFRINKLDNHLKGHAVFIQLRTNVRLDLRFGKQMLLKYRRKYSICFYIELLSLCVYLEESITMSSRIQFSRRDLARLEFFWRRSRRRRPCPDALHQNHTIATSPANKKDSQVYNL